MWGPLLIGSQIINQALLTLILISQRRISIPSPSGHYPITKGGTGRASVYGRGGLYKIRDAIPPNAADNLTGTQPKIAVIGSETEFANDIKEIDHVHIWCEEGELNPHGIFLPQGPQPCASTSSANLADFSIGNKSAAILTQPWTTSTRRSLRQKRRRRRVPPSSRRSYLLPGDCGLGSGLTGAVGIGSVGAGSPGEGAPGVVGKAAPGVGSSGSVGIGASPGASVPGPFL